MRTALLTAALCLAAHAATAKGLTAVRPIEGYVCKSLAATPQQFMDIEWPGIPIRTQPNASAPVDTRAAAVVFQSEPPRVSGPFVEVLELNGRTGWIERDKLKPFDQNARCVPSLMSNGKPGIG